ncbi:MAG: glycoside hydrolase family 31 protein [Chitinispirillaceae bacterium]|nr:glycoside hydrolase family 31 protein [Chitinispirillaceae bacterium]
MLQQQRMFLKCNELKPWNRLALAAALVGSFFLQTASAATMDTIGNVRVSCLSPILVRIEAKSSAGNFEDRHTLMVVQRDWPAVQRARTTEGTSVIITTANYSVTVPNNGSAITGTKVVCNTRTVFTYSTLPSGATNFPAPDELGPGYIIADAPRVVQPSWGSVPMPAGALPATDPLYATQGWDYRYTSTPDVYVFVNPQKNYYNDYLAVRKDFLRLTGPVPLVPRWFLGFANSRWQAVSDKYVLEKADRYRSEKIPIDIYVVDTDWRTGEYDYNRTYFPNPTQFFADMHARHFKVVFNDHPQGSGTDYQKRWNGLTSKMNDGLDFWWFDRNWTAIISAPVSGIDRETWGNKMYYDIQKTFLEQKYKKKLRPALFGMRSGDPANGAVDPISKPHPGSHRNPGWWTGDQSSTFNLMSKGVVAMVSDGIRLLPHVQNDIPGFMGCNPGDELYTRWMSAGCFSPMPRVHGTRCGEGSLKRYPWEFSSNTKTIVTRYLALRYRLMPMMYTALRKCYEDGSPLLQRCDLFWPSSANPSSKSNNQYLFGDDLLVRPTTATGGTMSTGIQVSTWIPPGDWIDAWTGQTQTGPKSINVDSKLWHHPLFVRKGSIITLCPDMLYTSEKPWNPITLEVFPPAAGGSVIRTLYEDDFETFNYETGEYTKTDISAVRTADGMRVTINPAQGGNFTGKLATRAWIVRLHLDAAHTAQQVKVNGAPVAIGGAWTKGNSPEARKLDPAPMPNPVTAANFPIPLQGEGQAAPASAAGPVIEVWVPAAATTTTQTVNYGADVGARSILRNGGLQGRFAVKNLASGRLQVSYTMPATSGDSRHRVKIVLTNLRGETVQTLVNKSCDGQYYNETVGVKAGAGVYLCKLTIDNATAAITRLTLEK